VAVRLSFRSFTYYWLDYLVGLVGYALAEGSSMAFIVAALFAFHAVDGWTFRPLVVLLGLSTLVRSIRTTFTASVVTIPELIQAGSFDTFLVRPVHPVLQAMNQPGSYPLGPAGIIAIPIAMFAFRYAGVKLSIQSLVLIVGTVVGGVLMLLVVDIAIASLSLWTAQSVEQGQMNRTMQYIQGAYSQYPLAVSPRWSGGR
jgi:ABC-2 type transport system permease protein